jgi:hypothetical protein
LTHSHYQFALREFKSLGKRVRQISRADARVRLLMSTPGVDPLVALTDVAAIAALAYDVGPAPAQQPAPRDHAFLVTG